MKASRTFGLSLLVLGLAAYVLLVERHRLSSEEKRALRSRAFQVDVDRVQRLGIRTAAYEVDLYTTNGVWQLRHPSGARASDSTVRRILSRLRSFSRGGLITVEDMRRQGNTLADYGLEVPDLVLNLETPSEQRQYRLGDPSPLGNKLYVKEESSQNVMLVSVDLLDILPETVDPFYDPAVFPFDPEAVEAFSLVRSDHTVRLERDGDGWRITEPRGLPADDAGVMALLTKLVRASAEGFVHSPEEENYGLDENRDTIRLWTQGSRVPYQVSLGDDAIGVPDACYARVEGREGLILVSRGVRALARTPMDALRDPRLLPPAAEWEVTGLVLGGTESPVRLQRDTAGWRMVQPVDRQAFGDRIEKLLEIWRAGRVVDFQASQDESAPAFAVTFQAAGSAASRTFQVHHSESLPGRSLVKTPDGSVVRVTPDLARHTPSKPEAYLSLDVLSFSPERVVRLNVTRGGEGREFSRGTAGDAWTMKDPRQLPMPAPVQRLIQTASSLQAVEVMELAPESLEPYGLETPDVRVSVGLGGEAPANRTLLLGPPMANGSSHAKVLGDGVIYRLSAEDTYAFRATLYRVLEEDASTQEDPDGENP